MRKTPFAGIELTSQRVRGLRGTSELPGRPVSTVGISITYEYHNMDQPGNVANHARGQLNRNKKKRPRSRLRMWSYETGSAVLFRVSLLILHTQKAESYTYTYHLVATPKRKHSKSPVVM